MTSTATHPNTTPYQIWWGKIPDFLHLRYFGSTAFVWIPLIKRKMLDAKSTKTILVGYESRSSNYRLYNPINNKIIISRHVTFITNCDSVKHNLTNSMWTVDISQVEFSENASVNLNATREEIIYVYNCYKLF